MADQKKYLVDFVIYFLKIVTNIIQIIVLMIHRSFLLYTIINILSGIGTNFCIAFITDKKYPYLKEKAEKLTHLEIRTIFKQIYAMFLYRICNIVGVATDNLIISSNINVLMVGLYDNYALIINVVQEVLSSVLHAFTGSLGNLFVTENEKKNAFVFRCLNLANLWFITFASVCFLILFQPFIGLWIGEKYRLDGLVVFIIVMNFATNHMQGVVQIFKDTTGLFERGKYRPVATVIINLVLSLILVRKIGIAGVFLGSIISRLCTTWWYDAMLIYKYVFHEKVTSFYKDCIVTTVVIIGLTAVLQGSIRLFQIPDSWPGLILQGILCVTVVNGFLIIKNRKKEEFGYLLAIIKPMTAKLLNRVKYEKTNK